MIQRKYIIRILHLLLFGLMGCLDVFQFDVAGQDSEILVVDAFLNANEGSILVKLTHSQSLSDTLPPVAERGAIVTLETETGEKYKVPSTSNGVYSLSGIPVDHQVKHRLRIKTALQKEYLSDDVLITSTPPIDSINFRGDFDGLSLLVSTHDDAGKSHYYSWEYVETWEYHSPQVSSYKLVNNLPAPRLEADAIYRCWSTHTSTNLHVATSNTLGGDVISEFPFIKIPPGNIKVSVRYSVLVRQRVVSEEEYNFLEELRKTSESLGGIFAPLPQKVLGNMHDLNDPLAPVLGYFSGGEVKEKRFFLNYADLPDNLRVPQPLGGCELQYVCLFHVPPPAPYYCNLWLEDLNDGFYIVAPVGNPMFGYSYTNIDCADCRRKGGTLTAPDFW